MELHPLARQFDRIAEDYDRGRPEYPPGAVGALAAELGLAPGDVVLDLAAGTGKLSRALLAGGFEVIAVEPQPSLREVLERRIGAERVQDGVAEAIPLPDGAVAAVTVADAFHWFDRPRALAEMRRVVRPGGGLAIIDMVRDWRGASWSEAIERIVVGSRPEHPNFDGAPWDEFVSAAEGWSEPWEVRVIAPQPAEPEQIVAHLASISWIAGLPEAEREATLAQIREAVLGGAMPERMSVRVRLGLARRD